MSQQIQPILSYSLPSNNLILISIVKLQDNINPYCFMMTLAPGIVDQQTGKRTYDFNSRITLKVQLDKGLAFGYYLKDLVSGLQVPQYSLISDPNKSQFGSGDLKSIGAAIQQKNNTPILLLFFKQGQNSKATQFTIHEGKAISDIIIMMANKAIELTLEEKGQQFPRNVQNPTFEQPQPFNQNQNASVNPATNPVMNAFVDAAQNIANNKTSNSPLPF